jgi:CCR4-NOT transcriptional regulation complex NOT5 subunit
MSTFQKTNTESPADSLSSDSPTSATPATPLINSTAATLTEGRSVLTTPDTSDPASTNGAEADETDQEAAPEVDDDEADQIRAIVDEEEAILEAALDPALEADQPEETAAADLVQHLVIDAQDRVLLARIVLDPDLPDVLDLAPVPDKVLLPKKQPKSRFFTFYQNICHAKNKKKVVALTIDASQ